MKIKAKEFLIDSLARANQIIFAVLIVGPFVTGFNMWLFGTGLIIYVILLSMGLNISNSIKEE
ncbi:MAG: hypothetical protein QME05_06750 [Candidatus Margulisbacteria bacterium]|nr:hypothetical protein [Candidatus Margulisiibacteriota bacterium]